MSSYTDKWRPFLSSIEDGLGSYEPNALIGDFIRVILKNRYEGIVLVDKEGRLAFMDKTSEKMFGLPPGGAKGRQFSDFFTDLGLLQVLKTGTPQMGQIQEVLGQKKIVTRFPIIRQGEVIGAVGRVVFQELEAIKALFARIEKLQAKVSLYREDLRATNKARYNFDQILGISEAISVAKESARRIATVDCTVLLVGESGTGKELFAHSIHQESSRSLGPFVKVNCAGIPFDLAESELFGYQKGAFTGASNTGQKGKFELASGGTIFLDEISSMPLALQGKLLRVIQEREIQPLGASGTKRVDFRLIAATNMDLYELVKGGAFRADLYYRLTSIPVNIPPLRQRAGDIPLLAKFLLPSIDQTLGLPSHSISQSAIDMLEAHDWPGNIRELINVLEQSSLNAYTERQITNAHLPKSMQANNPRRAITVMTGFTEAIRETEKEVVKKALDTTKGNKRQAAKILGISRAALYNKIRKLNIY